MMVGGECMYTQSLPIFVAGEYEKKIVLLWDRRSIFETFLSADKVSGHFCSVKNENKYNVQLY